MDLEEMRQEMLELHEHKKLDPALAKMADEHFNKAVRDAETAVRAPQSPPKYKEPYQYYEPSEGTGGLPAAVCTCGWSKRHLRLKVLAKAAEKHYNKTGHAPR